MAKTIVARIICCLAFVSALFHPGMTNYQKSAVNSLEPRLIKDTNGRGLSSDPAHFYAVNNVLFFFATDLEHGRELWKVDGTPPTATLVKDIYPGGESSYPPGDYTGLENYLLFSAYSPSVGVELWKSDGTTEGTVLVKDIYPGCTQNTLGCGLNSSYPSHMTVTNGWVYFFATDTTGKRLWRSDGTPEQTLPVADLEVDGSSLVAFDGWLYFSARYPNQSWELWRTNGVSESVERVEVPSLSGISIDHYLVVGDTLFFVAYFNGDHYGLLKADHSGTVLIKEVSRENTSIGEMFDFNGVFLFGIDSQDAALQGLWRSDGTETGTRLIASGRVYKIYGVVNNQLLFILDDGIHGPELWKTDGTPENSSLLIDITPGSLGGGSVEFAILQDVLYFQYGNHCDLSACQNELWRSDGTVEGTYLVKEIDKGTSGAANYSAAFLTPFQGKIYYSCSDYEHGNELWVSDGSPDGTRLFRDIYSRNDDGYIDDLTPFGNKVFFSAFYEPWVSDGTAQGTYMLVAPNTNLSVAHGPYRALRPVNANGIIYFLVSPYSTSPQITVWRSNGTAAGTQSVGQLTAYPSAMASLGTDAFGLSIATSGPVFWRAHAEGGVENVKSFNFDYSNYSYLYSSTNPFANIVRFKDHLYFFVKNSAKDQIELWSSDGTASNTLLVKAFPHGEIDFIKMTVTKNLVFINLRDFYKGWQLWQSNGTEPGTVLLETEPGSGISIEATVPVGDTLYFIGEVFTATSGTRSLFKTQGQTTGIQEIIGIRGREDPYHLAAVGNTVYFYQYRPDIGDKYLLWKSDGTTQGSGPICPDCDYDTNGDLTPFFGRLYFNAATAAKGSELWGTDGSTSGTNLVKDIYPGPSSALKEDARSLTPAGNNLFFVANDGYHGFELWAIHIQFDYQNYLPIASQ